MQLLKVYYAYFSPGNTTEKVLSRIASSFENYPVESINLTSYDERQQEHHFKENELLIIGVPAYGGRVPVPVVDALSRFSGLNTPVVLVATSVCIRSAEFNIMRNHKNSYALLFE